MILTVRNRRDTSETIDFTDSRTRDFVVVRENTDNVVWQLSEEEAAPSQTPTTLEFGPNEIKTFTTTWEQTDSDGGDQVQHRLLRSARRAGVRRLRHESAARQPARLAARALHDQLIRWRSRCITSTSSGSTIPRTSPGPGSRASSCGRACSIPCCRRSCSTRPSIPPSIEEIGPSRLRREIRRGRRATSDEVELVPNESLHIRADAAGEFAGSTLTIRIEEPAPQMLFVRFTYDVCGLEEVRDEQEDNARCSAYPAPTSSASARRVATSRARVRASCRSGFSPTLFVCSQAEA